MGRPDAAAVRALAALRELAPQKKAPQKAVLAVSGGADSMALAIAASVLHRRGELEALVGIVDHGLQAGSAEAADQARAACEGLGLPAEILSVTVSPESQAAEGLEAAARQARYAALAELAGRHGTQTVMTAHTLSDQAEQVLLGLGRGSGLRSLAGMRREAALETQAGPITVARPFLSADHGLWRQDTEHLCAVHGITPWQDPTNSPAPGEGRPRTRVRLEALPALERVFPGVRRNLVRTAALAGQDADLLEAAAAQAWAEVSRTGQGDGGVAVVPWRRLHPALKGRVRAAAMEECLGVRFPKERVDAVARLMEPREEGGADSPGPVELGAGAQARRGRFLGASGKMEMILVFERL